MVKLEKYYVTTPLYYVNDVPHIGHAYTTIAADILARYQESLGKDVFLLTGTDEHGQKIQEAAKAAGLPPKAFADKLAPRFKLAWKKLDIDYDHFIRTTDKYHEAAVKKILEKVHKKGDIYKGFYEGLYCVGCEAFYTEKDLVNGKCPIHNKTPKEIREKSYFFRLSKYQDALLDLYEQRPDFVLPKTRFNEVKARVREGLRDLSISRTSFKWGIPIPWDKKHVNYVWFDALNNYITALGWPEGKNFKKYWPADVHLIGKDILWFHAVIWPAMLLSTGVEPPKCVFAHGWWTVDGQKMSKSLSNVIDPLEMAKKYGVDAFRYILFREAVFGQDGDFSEKVLVERYNGELANELGNLVSRGLTLIEKNGGKVPKGNLDKKLETLSNKVLTQIKKDFENIQINKALEHIWEFIRTVNKYIQDKKPWTKPKDLNNILYSLAESLRIISALVYPFIPNSAKEIVKQLGINKIPKLIELDKSIRVGIKVKKGKLLFPKLEYAEKKKIFNLDIRIGKVVSCEEVPDSKKLYKLQIDFGEFKRQAVAGLKPYFKTSEIKGKNFVFLVNLEPAKLADIKSECMILAAMDKDKVDLLISSDKIGTKIGLEDYELAPAKKVNLNEFSNWKFKVKDGKVFSGNSELNGISSKFKKGKVA